MDYGTKTVDFGTKKGGFGTKIAFHDKIGFTDGPAIDAFLEYEY